MTNEQAIRALHYVRESFALDVDSYEALNMAIEALNFVSEHHQSNIETYAHDMGVSLEQAERELRVEELSCSEEPNKSDTIYRQDAIDVAKQHWYKPDIAKALEELPSAQPENTILKAINNIRALTGCEELIITDKDSMRTWDANGVEYKLYPERKKGHWIKISPANIYECSECGKNVMTDDISAYDFCHGCGAEMEGEKHV